jgi:hypothetical protein
VGAALLVWAGSITTVEGSVFSFTMGSTVRPGHLAIDAVLDPAFFNNPFAQLAGSDGAAFEGWLPTTGTRGGRADGTGPGVAFPQISLSYNW